MEINRNFRERRSKMKLWSEDMETIYWVSLLGIFLLVIAWGIFCSLGNSRSGWLGRKVIILIMLLYMAASGLPQQCYQYFLDHPSVVNQCLLLGFLLFSGGGLLLLLFEPRSGWKFCKFKAIVVNFGKLKNKKG